MVGAGVGELRDGDPVALGPWRLLGVLGEGGMGTVYLGQQGRPVAAVKTVRGDLVDDPRSAARFRREHQAADAVHSPYVPRLLGADLDDQQPWIATEFVAGPTLERCVEERGPLPADSVRALGAMLASALAALHAAGVVHRDLKPSNVLLAADGPRLIDFGIARIPAATTVTVTGQRPGSAGYMSPEQILGRELGPPSDVFTLGAVLAYASTGHPAFGGDGGAFADFAIVHEEPELSRVPDALVGVVRRCLDKETDRRPDAGSVAAQWGLPPAPAAAWLPEHVVRDIGELEQRVGALAVDRPARPSRRRVLGLAGSAVMLTGLGGAGWRWLERDGGSGDDVPLWDGPPGERPAPVWSTSGLAPDMPFGPAQAGDVLLVANQGGRVTALEPGTGEPLWSYASASAPVPGAAGPVLIGRDGVLRAVDSHTGEVKWRGPGGLARLLAVEAETVYAADSDGRVVAVRQGAREVSWRTGMGVMKVGAVAAVGGGALVLTTGGGDVIALDSASGGERWTAQGAVRGQRVALGGGLAVLGETPLVGLDAESGTERWRAESSGEFDRFRAPVIHGGRVYVANGDLVRCIQLADGSGVREITGAGGAFAPGPPVVAAHGLYVPLEAGPDGVAAFPLAGNAERYRFAPRSEADGAWAVAAAGQVVAVQNGADLYALPRF
ncbi:PQQ-binding-like beta-propeller repeat protein [Streptomyces sp. NPDC050418]|uniref:protein kinase domain-containing protein n=1 Tax=Streptomyces sp. NPDC050418 TaxID=3365612 RepID=UPI00379FB5D0